MKTNRMCMIISLVLMLVVNIVANWLPLNGLRTYEVVDRFSIYFLPAGIYFFLLGLIYATLIGFLIYSVTSEGLADEKIDNIACWFSAANLLGTVWVILWHYLLIDWTLIPILFLLICLLVIYDRLKIGELRRSFKQTLLVSVPFGLYLGWMTVLIIVSISQVLYLAGWYGEPMTAYIWAVLMIWVATTMGLSSVYTRREVAYPLALVWSFISIWIRNKGAYLVGTMSIAMAIALSVIVFLWLILSKVNQRLNKHGR